MNRFMRNRQGNSNLRKRDLNPLVCFRIKTVHISKGAVPFQKVSYVPFSKPPQIRYYSDPNSKFLQNPHSYSFHIIISHHFIHQKPKINHESITIQRYLVKIHSGTIFERKRERPIRTRFSCKVT